MNLTASEIVGLVGAAATIVTVFFVPFMKYLKKAHEQKVLSRLEQEGQSESIKIMAEKLGQLIAKSEATNEKLEEFWKDYDVFTIQNYKYMINDAYFGYNDISEIPDEVLTNACECCDIYVNQKGRNHEIKPRCVRLWKEQENRALLRGHQDE